MLNFDTRIILSNASTFVLAFFKSLSYVRLPAVADAIEQDDSAGMCGFT